MQTVSISAPSSTTKVLTLSDLYKHFDRINSVTLRIARTSPLKFSDPRIAPFAQRADRIATLIRKMDVVPTRTTATGYIDFSVN